MAAKKKSGGKRGSSGSRRRPRRLSAAEAVQGARNALAVADSTVDSQLHVHAALGEAAAALEREKADPEQIEIFEQLVETRGKLLANVAARTVMLAEAEWETSGVKHSLAQALRAAEAVYEAVDPDGAELEEIRKKIKEIGADSRPAPARPFFARFLENQNRQRASSLQEQPPEVVVTLKAPSDHEDGPGAELDDGVKVTLKFPSDQEEGGPVTRKYPSDEEDCGTDGVVVTLKAPSDHEDEGAGLDDAVFVTLKYPSDHDEGETPIETRKFPSDQEDTSLNTLAETPVTLKAPSDHEDGGDFGDVVVTLKAPSDHEDEIGPPVQTEKFPSDAEDTGPHGHGPVTLKFPSDSEDGGHPGPDDKPRNPVTLKFPSDCEDGESEEHGPLMTLKFPSDQEDGYHVKAADAVTAKFPSDHEDGGLPLGDLPVVTLKFPSDNDEGDSWLYGGSNVTTAKFPSDKDEELIV